MSSGGSTVPVVQAPVETGFGENTIVWIPDGLDNWDYWPAVTEDTTYRVDLSGVITGEGSRDFSYDVTIFDPDSAAPPPDGTETATLTPSTTITPTVTLTTTTTPSNFVFIPLVLSGTE